MSEFLATIAAPLLGLGGLVYAFLIYRDLASLPDGDEKMREIASSIHDGAMVFQQLQGFEFGFGFSWIGTIHFPLGYIHSRRTVHARRGRTRSQQAEHYNERKFS